MGKLLSYSQQDSVATIILDDGKANALSLAMQAEINSAIDLAVKDNAIILLTGRPDRFSAGFDMATLTAGGQPACDMLLGGFAIAKRLLAHPRPVVVACSGHAMAMGLFLVLCGDYCIGAEGDFKLCANEVAIGLTLPVTAVEICRNRLNNAHFARATLTSEVYSPDAAIAAGMLDEVTNSNALLDRATQKAMELLALDHKAYGESKQQLRANLMTTLDDAMSADAATFRSMFGL